MTTTQLTERNHQEIAVVGYSARFPGAADADAYRTLIYEGGDPVSRTEASGPGVVDAHASVDAGWGLDLDLFGIDRRSATILAPHMRTALELSHEALTHAAIVPNENEDIGLFIGSGPTGHVARVKRAIDELGAVDALTLRLATDPDFVASRVSYHLDLTGPSVGVQTACSSGATAVHLACRSLQADDCEVALAGAASLDSPPKATPFVRGSILSRRGQCEPFGAEADGTVGGEGGGLLVLMPLAKARKRGLVVHAVIRGSAINNDGRGRAGFTVPGSSGQVRAIHRALGEGGINPGEVGFVQAHGTATPVGDKIERRALGTIFPEGTTVGSVKGQIGHCDAASGIAGILSAIFAVRDAKLPPSFGSTEAPAGPDGFRFPQTLRDWQTDTERVAVVSSLGMGGANAHIVVAGPSPVTRESQPRPGDFNLRLSAASETAADLMADRVMAWAAKQKPDFVWDAAVATAAEGRPELRYRVVVTVHVDTSFNVTATRTSVVDSNTHEAKASGEWLQGGPPPRQEPSVITVGAVELPAYPYQRTRLPLLEAPNGESQSSAPSNKVSADSPENGRGIATIMGSLLGRDSFSSEDDFFNEGGDSMLALDLVEELQRRLSIVVDPEDLYTHSTPSALNRFVSEQASEVS